MTPHETAEGPVYTKYHPRWYRTRTPIFWWTNKWSYIKFIVRELTSLAVAWFALLLLCLVRAVGQGQVAYDRLRTWLDEPAVAAFHLVLFLLLLYHSVTWFALAPRAMVVKVGKKRLPDLAISGPNFVAWAVVSAVVAWILLRSGSS